MASPAPLPLWTFWVQALSVPALAAVGAIIAFQQMSIARTKLQHDLFDRRVEVYSAIRAALTYIEDCGDVTWEGLSRLHTATSVVPFLFPRRLRWSRPVGQFGGRVKLGPGCCQAANLSVIPAPYASSGVRPANVE